MQRLLGRIFSELLSEVLTPYFPFLFFVVVALGFGMWSFVVSYLVQPKYPEPDKLSTYECGSEPFSTTTGIWIGSQPF